MKDGKNTRRNRVLWVVLFHFLSFVSLSSASAQTRPIYIGGGITGGFNFHDLNAPIIRNDTLCGVFQSGTSILPSGFLTFEMPLGDPASSFWIAPRIDLSGLGALISAPAADQARARAPDSSLVPVARAYHLDANILSLGADLFVKYPLFSRFFLFGGPSISYLLRRDATLTEVITDPPQAVFPGTGSNSRSVPTSTVWNSTGQILNSTSILASATLGASLDIPLSPKVVVAPELSVRFPINSIRTDYKWHITTVSLGAALKFDISPEPKLVVVKPPPPPPAPEPAKSEMSATVKISGVVKDSVGVEHEIPEPQIRIEEFLRREAYPTLNYVFFGEDSAVIPARYHLLKPEEASTFTVTSLSGASLVDVYHEELNILGKRLEEKPSTSITVTGTNGASPKEAADTSLARRRAEAVREYLVNTWKIDPSRIRIQTENLPRKPSSTDTKEGMQENRRVEVTSNDPAFLDPLVVETIDRTMNPPKIRMRTTEFSRLPLVENTLSLTQGDRVLTSFREPGPMREWNPKPEDLPRTDSPLVATVHMTDSIGTTFVATDSSHVEQLTVRKKREERRADRIIEHYNLITFDFDKSDLDERSQRVIREIAQSITPNDKIVIRGYTDITGERSHNFELSQARAQAVETALRSSLGDKASSVVFQTQGEGQLNLVDNRLPEGRFLSRTVFVELQKPVQ